MISHMPTGIQQKHLFLPEPVPMATRLAEKWEANTELRRKGVRHQQDIGSDGLGFRKNNLSHVKSFLNKM